MGSNVILRAQRRLSREFMARPAIRAALRANLECPKSILSRPDNRKLIIIIIMITIIVIDKRNLSPPPPPPENAMTSGETHPANVVPEHTSPPPKLFREPPRHVANYQCNYKKNNDAYP